MDSNKKTIDMKIERRCPICGGKVEISTHFNKYGVTTLGIPIFLIFWYAYLDGRTQKRIEDLSDCDIRLFASIFDSCPIRSCERCKHMWDEFNETDFVLQSNDDTLIKNYMSLVEKSVENPAFTINRPLTNNLSEKEKRERELHWRLNLVKAKIYQYKINLTKARLYQYQYKNQSNSQSNNDIDYYHLYHKALQEAEKCRTNNQNLLSYEYELKADMCDDDDILQRFYYLNAALTSDISVHRKTKIQNNIGEIYSAVLDRWKEPINVDKRRIIFIANNLDDIAGYYDPTNSINLYFTIDKIPSSIKFPYGRPKGNELYIAHRVNPDEYIPYEGHEELLFMDKIRELRRLLRYLGATEITFTSIKGKSIEEIQREGQKVSVDGGFLGHEASVSRSSDEQQKQRSSIEQKVDFIEVLNPYKYPSIPEDLHWSDPEWKVIAEARLHSDERLFIQEISTKQVTSLTEQSQLYVNAAYENLISHINVKYHSDRKFHVETSEETKWRITAKFKPLNEFEKNDNTISHLSTGTQKNLSSDEKVYLEAVEEYLGDGSISERDRRMLEHLRKSLGISEERALVLEATLVPQLTDDEKDYLEALKECLKEGGINDRYRRTLERLRKSLDINEERARKLEAMA